MKRLLLPVLLLAGLFSPIAAQNLRTVRGLVRGEDKNPLPGILLTPSDNSVTAFSAEDGTFEIQVGYDVASLTASGNDWQSVTQFVDGSFLIFTLKKDMLAIKEREQAVRDSIRREEQRLQAIADSVVRAEQAREKAVRDSIRREEKQRQALLDQEKKQQQEQAAREKREARDKAYEERFGAGDKGFAHDISLSYLQALGLQETVIYKYSGQRNYSNLYPLLLTYTFSYKLHRMFSVGIGTGVLYNIRSITIGGDEFSPTYGNFTEKQLSIPLYVELKFRPFKSVVRPILEVKGGWYLLSNVYLVDAAIGAEYRFTPTMSSYLSLGVSTVPWPSFRYSEHRAGYKADRMPFVRIGVSL